MSLKILVFCLFVCLFVWARQWWHTPLIPTLGRQMQADFWVWGQPGLQRESQDSQDYTEKTCLEKPKTKTKTKTQTQTQTSPKPNNNNNNKPCVCKDLCMPMWMWRCVLSAMCSLLWMCTCMCVFSLMCAHSCECAHTYMHQSVMPLHMQSQSLNLSAPGLANLSFRKENEPKHKWVLGKDVSL